MECVLLHLTELVPHDIVELLQTHKPVEFVRSASIDNDSKPDWEALKQQYELQNPGKKQFFCQDCQRGFSRIYELDRHIKTVHVEKVTCVYCHRALKVANRKDMQRKHLQFKCAPFLRLDESVDNVDLSKCFIPFK
eukprot:NODE_379_length_8451_cov_0.593630.p8 type:complete len:136 gc:universal NODE_379_length_8451_cov_0.593630:2122-2529(+)